MPPPAVPGPSFGAILAVAAALIALAGPLLARLLRPDSGWRSAEAAGGFAIGAGYAVWSAFGAMREIRKRPGEVYGAWIAWVAVAIGAAAFVVAGTIVARQMGWLPPIL